MSGIPLSPDTAGQGNGSAPEELLHMVYDELRHLAASRMRGVSGGHTLQPTALVHEAWLRLASQEEPVWNNREHFFRVAALAMRQILVDRIRRKASLKGGGGLERLDIENLELSEATPDDRILMINDALNRLEKTDFESFRIVTLKFFGGFTNWEIAENLGISERAVERHWTYARATLLEMIQQDVPHESA
jgi:RNA polymerase sigma factor (TIGR02999 family)